MDYLDQEKPIIKHKTLKIISRELAIHYSEQELVEALEELDIDEKQNNPKETAEELLYNILVKLSADREDRKNWVLLSRIVTHLIHPLNLDGDLELSKTLKEKINNLLHFDYLEIVDIPEGHDCRIERIRSFSDSNFVQNDYRLRKERWSKLLVHLRKDGNKIEILKIRESFKVLMNVIEVFCTNLTPTVELNNLYLDLKKSVWCTLLVIRLRRINDAIDYHYPKPPFKDLFSAEKEYLRQNKILKWELIRPEMYSMLGDLNKLCEEVGVEGLFVPEEVQKKLDVIELFLTELKERKQFKTSQTPITKIEISKMPELRVKGFEEKVILQKPSKQRIRLRHFPKDTKWENITIKFLDNQEVLVTVKKETFHSDFKDLGFADDKTHLPNKQWEFLKGLSETGGELSWKHPKASHKGKKQKQLLKEGLMAYFQIDNDPFCEYRKEKMYKIKINLIPEGGSISPSTEQKPVLTEDNAGIAEYYKKQTPLVYDEFNK